MTDWYSNGLKFSCTQCHSCCRHDPGYVFLSQPDLDTLCEFHHMDEKIFRRTFCRTVDFTFTKRLSLIEKTNFDCIFWDKGCTVYEARPLQCRSFPFWSSNLHDKDAWDASAIYCPGMNQGKIHTVATINEWLRAREQEPYLED